MQDVIPEDQGVLQDAAVVAKDYLLLTYLRDVVHHLEIVSLDGKYREAVKLPGKGKKCGREQSYQFK